MSPEGSKKKEFRRRKETRWGKTWNSNDNGNARQASNDSRLESLLSLPLASSPGRPKNRVRISERINAASVNRGM